VANNYYQQYGVVISEEEAMRMTINSVSTFWSMGSLGAMVSGNIFPLHIVHAWINYIATT
jgi:hypothetical protein